MYVIYAYIRIQIIDEIKTLIVVLALVLPVRVLLGRVLLVRVLLVQSSPVLEIPYAFFSLCSSALVQFVLRNVFGLASPDKNTQTSMGTVRRIGRSGKAEKTTAQSGKYVGVVRSCQG